MIRLLSMYRNEGTVIVFEGEDVDTGEHVLVAGDHRPAMDIRRAMHEGREVLVDPEEWAIMARWQQPLDSQGNVGDKPAEGSDTE